MLNPRLCIVSRRTFEAGRLIRFVAAPDGRIVADLKRRLPGRGAHVEARREAVEAAVRRKLFSRALKLEAKGTEALGADVERLLLRQVVDFLGLARKAGALVAGAAKTDMVVRAGAAIAVMHAADGAPDGVRKIDGARRARALGTQTAEIPSFHVLSGDEMGLPFAGGNVVHAAVLAGEAGAALLKRLEALAIYRGLEAGSGSGAATGPAAGGGLDDAASVERDGAARAAAPGRDVGCGRDPAQEAEA